MGVLSVGARAGRRDHRGEGAGAALDIAQHADLDQRRDPLDLFALEPEARQRMGEQSGGVDRRGAVLEARRDEPRQRADRRRGERAPAGIVDLYAPARELRARRAARS